MRFICRQILDDVTFMAEHNLMDYSLLLITEKNPEYWEARNRTESVYTSSDFQSNNQPVPEELKDNRMSIIPEAEEEELEKTQVPLDASMQAHDRFKMADQSLEKITQQA